MPTITRIECPKCKASCIEGESNCWQCAALLRPQAAPTKTSEPARIVDPTRRSFLNRFPRTSRSATSENAAPEQPAELIAFDPDHIANMPAPIEAPANELPESSDDQVPILEKRTRVTLTGEVIDDDEVYSSAAPASVAATIGSKQIEAPETEEVMILTFCKECGQQNVEYAKKCGKCGRDLDVIAVSDYHDIEAPPRAWGFDVLGVVWVILGISAIFAGQFLVQTNAGRPPGFADYLWTGVVAIAPGVFVFMRHHFCRTMFWVMTLGSIMVWSVLTVMWFLGHLRVSDNGQVGLSWLFALSCLSAISFFLVRTNDAFDYDIGMYLGRQ